MSLSLALFEVAGFPEHQRCAISKPRATPWEIEVSIDRSPNGAQSPRRRGLRPDGAWEPWRPRPHGVALGFEIAHLWCKYKGATSKRMLRVGTLFWFWLGGANPQARSLLRPLRHIDDVDLPRAFVSGTQRPPAPHDDGDFFLPTSPGRNIP